MSLDDHLSRMTVANHFKRLTWSWRATYAPIKPCFGWGLHCFRCYHRNGSLLHCLFTLARYVNTAGGYVSVALSWESPPPAVNRHPCPMKPGLSSPCKYKPRSSGLLFRISIITLVRDSFKRKRFLRRFHSLNQTFRTDPPINSRSREVLFTASGARGKK